MVATRSVVGEVGRDTRRISMRPTRRVWLAAIGFCVLPAMAEADQCVTRTGLPDLEGQVTRLSDPVRAPSEESLKLCWDMPLDVNPGTKCRTQLGSVF